MDSSLGKLIVSLAAMSESSLRNIRREMHDTLQGSGAGELVLELIDLYINVGEDTDLRAKAAAGLLMKLVEIDDDDEKESVTSSSDTSAHVANEGGGNGWLYSGLAVMTCFIGVLSFL